MKSVSKLVRANDAALVRRIEELEQQLAHVQALQREADAQKAFGCICGEGRSEALAAIVQNYIRSDRSGDYANESLPDASDPPRAATRDGQEGTQAEPSELTKRIDLSLRLGQILGREYDGVPLDDIARELVALKLTHASLVQEMETYLQHHGNCGIDVCAKCGHGRGLHYNGRAMGYGTCERVDDFVSRGCSCGLESKLALLRRSARPETTD